MPAFSTLTAAINDAGVVVGEWVDDNGVIASFFTDSNAVNHGFELIPAR